MHNPWRLMEPAEHLIRQVEAALVKDDEAHAVALLKRVGGGATLPASASRKLAALARSIDRNDLALEAIAAGPASVESRLVAMQLRAEDGEAVADELAVLLGPAPRPGAPLLQLVGALDLEGRAAEAIRLIETSLPRERDWMAGHQSLAQLRWQAGDEEPTRSFAEALLHVPAHELLWAAWLGTIVRTNDWSLFDRVAAEASKRFPGSQLVAMVCADGFSEMGRENVADRLFAQLAEVADADFDSARMRHAMRWRRLDDAIRIGERAVSTHGAGERWAWLGAAWRLAGDARSAWFHQGTDFISVVELAFSDDELRALAKTLRGLHRAAGPPLGQSPRGGTQTPGPLLKRSEFEIRQLRQKLKYAVRRYINRLPPPDPRHPFLGRPRRAFRFEGAWSIRLLPGGRHVSHIHSHGWISSALYVDLPEEMTQSASKEGWLQFGVPLLPEDEPQAEPLKIVAPVVGRLALFPSIFWHGTRPFADGERLTVAFDVVPR